jgi:hypothetical protein
VKTAHYSVCHYNYTKALARLEKNIHSGRFARYTQQKKQEIWNRLCRYARQLGITIKSSVIAACIVAGLSLSMPASGQLVFTQQTGGSNPLNSVTSPPPDPHPVFVDIDNDGDRDVFIGDQGGLIRYFRNTGTASSPTFTQQTGLNNPLNGSFSFYNVSPTFVDIDNDGDQDLFVGDLYGAIRFYRNTGTAASPAFSSVIGAGNPLNGVDVGDYAAPIFKDIDNDGDKDAFIGSATGAIFYYKNTGTASAPVLTLQAGASNPLNSAAIVNVAVMDFADLDGDGDLDTFIGQNNGTIRYFRNTGTATSPAFTEQTGVSNPLNGVDVGFRAKPAFADLNGDNKSDLFIGSGNLGTISYYQNNSIILPLRLINFSGNKQAGYNQLKWETADEENTKWFEIERSSDGRSFTTIATVNASGSGNHTYNLNDNVISRDKLFYRLRMVDIDSRYTYSNTIWIDSDEAASIILYPNPARDVMNINTGSTRILKTMAEIYDADGRLIRTVLIANYQQQINISALTPGIYAMKFSDGTIHRFLKE